MSDKERELERSELWNDIREVLARLPFKATSGDSFDRNSAAVEIEAIAKAFADQVKLETLQEQLDLSSRLTDFGYQEIQSEYEELKEHLNQ